MRLNLEKKWFMDSIKAGDSDFVEAGLHLVPSGEEKPLTGSSAGSTEELNIAFGKFIKLMRRKMEFTIEMLAEQANIDAEEILEIEDNLYHKPDIRSVFQLANFFKIDSDRMLQMAQLIVPKDMRLFEEAIRFAARSEPVKQLTSQESIALDAFVAFLSKR